MTLNGGQGKMKLQTVSAWAITLAIFPGFLDFFWWFRQGGF